MPPACPDVFAGFLLIFPGSHTVAGIFSVLCRCLTVDYTYEVQQSNTGDQKWQIHLKKIPVANFSKFVIFSARSWQAFPSFLRKYSSNIVLEISASALDTPMPKHMATQPFPKTFSPTLRISDTPSFFPLSDPLPFVGVIC